MEVILLYASNENKSQRWQETATHYKLPHQHTTLLRKFQFIWNVVLAPNTKMPGQMTIPSLSIQFMQQQQPL
jgi:hypothetical protein